MLREGLPIPPIAKKIFKFNLTFPLGLEAVIFVGGVSLGQPATSIPIAAIVGIICGLIIGFLIYGFASRTSKTHPNSPTNQDLIVLFFFFFPSALSIFLVVMTNLILLIGAGLFSKAVGAFESYVFNRLLGSNVDDAGGDGPGSYRVQGNVWHLNCCNPNNRSDGQGWNIFTAIFGWTHSATCTHTPNLETRSKYH